MKKITYLSCGDGAITVKAGNEYILLEPCAEFKFRGYDFAGAAGIDFFSITESEQKYLELNTEVISERS